MIYPTMIKQKATLLYAFFVAALVVLPGAAWGQYVVNFEGTSETKGSYASGTVNLSGLTWDLTEVLIGSIASDWKNGTRSARLRGYANSSMTMTQDKPNGMGTISFLYRRFGTDTQVDWQVEYSINNGASWTRIGNVFTAPATDAVQSFSAVVNIPGNIRIRIKRATETGTSDNRLNIDDIIISDFNTVNFDLESAWSAGDGALNSYQNNHTFTTQQWVFTGGPALRQGNAGQDGFPGAIGTYSWRIGDFPAADWRATFTSRGKIRAFGFRVRRWDNDPDPDYSIQYSANGGSTFLAVGSINNAFLNGSSDWRVFSHTFPVPLDVGCGSLVISVLRNNGERIMIDDFGFLFEEASSLHYRTTSTGNWNNACIWEVSANGSDPWNPSYFTPGQTALSIILNQGHKITIDRNISIRHAVIQANAELEVGSNAQMTLVDGGRIFIENGGLMHFNGAAVPVIGNNALVQVNTGATIRVSIPASGISNVLAGNESNGRISYQDGAVFQWNSTASFHSANQTYFPGSTTSTIPVFRLTQSISLPVGSTQATTINGLFEANGNITWQNSGNKIFRNGISGTGTVTQAVGSGLFIIDGQQASLTIANLDLKESLSATSQNLASGGTNLSITGVSQQTITLPPPGPHPVRVESLRVINAAGVIINQDVLVSGTLTMMAGNISNQGSTIIVGESVTNPGNVAHTSGTIFGRLKRWIRHTDSQVYMFPVGKPSFNTHASVQFTTGPQSGGSLTAEFINPMPGNYYLATPISISGNPSLIIDDVPDEGFWRLDAGNGLRLFTYTLTLNASNINQINVPEGIRVLKRNLGDDASNYQASGAWTTGSNMGSGFENWNLWTDGGGGNAGHFVFTSTEFGHGNINSDLSAFGMFGHSSRWAHARRTLANWGNGFELHADIAVQWRDGSRGVSFYNASNQEIFNFNISDAGYGSTGWPYHSDMVISLRAIQNGSNIDVALTGRSALGNFTSSPFNHTISNQTLSAFRLYTGTLTNTGNIDNNRYNLYFNNLRIISPWAAEGTTTHLLNPLRFSVSGLSSFSDFTLGGFHLNNPLPIELLSFAATYKKGKVLVQWSTGSEINNDYFTIERSRDAVNTEIIGHVDGAGNSTRTLHYRFTDNRPHTGVSYYRLKQTDFDGSFEYSKWVAVQADAAREQFQVLAVSSPSGVLLRIYSPTGQPLQVQLADIYGRIVHSEQFYPGSPGHIETFVPIKQSAPSVLLYRITDGLDVVTGKVIR